MIAPVLLIHGGLNSEKTFRQNYSANQDSIEYIANKGYEYLLSHNAMETAVFVTKLLEDDAIFNAGTGSTIQSDGIIRMSASLMDGATQIFSGVMNIENIKNPIELAASLQKEKDRVLAAEQAESYARNLGFSHHNPETPERKQDYEKKKSEIRKPTSTVGCVVLDNNGNLAAATSTGGKGFEIPGRVGDSPTIAGNYANKHAAVSATGCGEDIISVGLACKIVTRISDGVHFKITEEKAIKELNDIKGSAGFIGLTEKGETFTAATSPYLVWAKITAEKLELFE